MKAYLKLYQITNIFVYKIHNSRHLGYSHITDFLYPEGKTPCSVLQKLTFLFRCYYGRLTYHEVSIHGWIIALWKRNVSLYLFQPMEFLYVYVVDMVFTYAHLPHIAIKLLTSLIIIIYGFYIAQFQKNMIIALYKNT